MTYRRVAEAFGHDDVAVLRTRITTQHPGRDTGLLWAIGTGLDFG